MLDPAVEARPWDEQVAADAASYREQLAYLFERSAFYREKLAAHGIESARDAGALGEDRPAAAHREGRAEGDRGAGQPRRSASLRPARRDRPHLLDERQMARKFFENAKTNE